MLFSLFLPSLFGCSPGHERDSEGAISGGDVPTTSGGAFHEDTITVLTLLFSPLMHHHSGEVKDRLARSREMSPDGRSWTYHLRTDAYWQDGAPVTAHDVKFTVELFQNPTIANPLATQMGRGRRVTIQDDSTFTVAFETYRADTWISREVFLPKHLLAMGPSVS